MRRLFASPLRIRWHVHTRGKRERERERLGLIPTTKRIFGSQQIQSMPRGRRVTHWNCSGYMVYLRKKLTSHEPWQHKWTVSETLEWNGIHKCAKCAINSAKRAESNNSRPTYNYIPSHPSFDTHQGLIWWFQSNSRANQLVAYISILPSRPWATAIFGSWKRSRRCRSSWSIGKVMWHGQHPDKINMWFCAQWQMAPQ